jgi:flotillin
LPVIHQPHLTQSPHLTKLTNNPVPAVFTIGPHDDKASLEKYAVLLTGDSDGQVSAKGTRTIATGRNHVQDIVKGIIEGETRSIVSNMTMEELFNNRRLFKRQVIECVQNELDQFGLRIYNANVKELQDMGESKYFESLARKAHEGAQSQAQVDVAHARMIGRVGEAEKEGEAKQRIAKINAHTAVLETERKVEKANADQKLRTREITIARELNLEQIASDRAAQHRDAELQRGVEEKRAAMELERLRATTVTQAKIQRESAQQHADAEFYNQSKQAEAHLINQRAEADAIAYSGEREAEIAATKKTRDAEASFFVKQKEAQADFFARQQEAAGITEMAKAYGELANVLGGPQGLMQYLMLQNNTYEKLTLANAKAINGLQPKINVWNTGSAGAEGADSMAPIRNLFQTLPPLLSTIQDQTGMTPPAWLAGMPEQNGQHGDMTTQEKVRAKQEALMNGNGH